MRQKDGGFDNKPVLLECRCENSTVVSTVASYFGRMHTVTVHKWTNDQLVSHGIHVFRGVDNVYQEMLR